MLRFVIKRSGKTMCDCTDLRTLIRSIRAPRMNQYHLGLVSIAAEQQHVRYLPRATSDCARQIIVILLAWFVALDRFSVTWRWERPNDVYNLPEWTTLGDDWVSPNGVRRGRRAWWSLNCWSMRGVEGVFRRDLRSRLQRKSWYIAKRIFEWETLEIYLVSFERLITKDDWQTRIRTTMTGISSSHSIVRMSINGN